MRRINLKLLLWLGIPTVLLAGAVHTLWSINVDRSTQAVLEQAHHALDAGQLPVALRYFSEYLHRRPDDSEQLCRAALTAAEVAKSNKPTMANVRYAYQIMERALRNAPDRTDVRRELIQLLTRAGGFHEARNHIERLEKAGVRDIDLDYVYAQCAMVDGDESVALGRLEALIGFDPIGASIDSRHATAPDMICAYVLMADILRQRRGNDRAADVVMDHLVTANPKRSDALLARGRYLRQQAANGPRVLRAGFRERAEVDLRKALALDPNAVEVLLENARLAMDSGDYETATSQLDTAMAQHPLDRHVYLLRARLAGLQDDPLMAARNYEKGLKALPDDPELVWRLFEVRLQSADRRGAMATIDVMRTLTFPADRVTLAEAQIALMHGRWNEARRQLEAIRPQVTRSGDFSKSIDLLLAQCYEHLGQPDRQLEVCDRVLAVDPDNVSAQSAQVRALIQLQRFNEAMTRLTLLRRSLGAEAFERSVSRMRMFSQVATLLDRQNRGRDLADAKFELDPDAVSQATLLLDKARQLAGTGGPDAERQLEALEAEITTVPSEQRADVWRGFGAAYYRLTPQCTDDVQRCWRQASTLRPDDPNLLELLFDLAVERHDRAGMADVLETSERSLGRSSSLWQYFRAKQLVWMVQHRYADMGALDEAAERMDVVGHQRPNWHLRLRLEGTIHDLQGNTGSAIERYQESLAVGPPHGGTVRRLVELFMVQGRTHEARRTLHSLDPTPVSLWRHRVVLEAFGGDRTEALLALALAVPEDATDPVDLIWKGHVLDQMDLPDRAERAFRQAVQMGPNLPKTWLALVEHLVTAGKMADASRVVRDAECHVSEPSAPMLLARCYERIEDHVAAEHYFQSAIAARPDTLRLRRELAAYYLRTQQVAKAMRSLRQVVRQAEQRNQPHSIPAAWARRALATLHAAEGDYPNFRRALALLDANRNHGVVQAEDMRVTARILGARPEPRSRRQAVRLLESMRTRQPLSFEERFLLARLYYQATRWPECRELMLDLVTENGQHASVLATFVEMLVERDEASAARPWLRHLTAIQPDTLQTIRLTAQLQLAQGDREKAIDTVDSWLADPDAPRHTRRLWHVAQLLEALELYDEAERRYRQLVRLDANQQRLLAAFQMRRGMLDEAFDLCERAEGHVTLHALCQIAEVAVDCHGSRLSTGQQQIIAKWIERAKQKWPDSFDVPMQEAAFLSATGQTKEAVARLETILARAATATQRAQAANNLAFLLAANSPGRSTEALRLIDQAIKGLGPQVELLDTRAMIYLAQGDFARARKDLQEATHFGAPTGEYYFHLALAHQGANDRSAARRALYAAREARFSEDDLPPVQRQQIDDLHRWLLQTGPAT